MAAGKHIKLKVLMKTNQCTQVKTKKTLMLKKIFCFVSVERKTDILKELGHAILALIK